MSEGGVAAAHQFEMQTRLLNEEWKAVKINIGQQVMPQLSGLIASLNQVSGPVINAVVVAVKGLIMVLENLATIFVYIYDVAKGVFTAIGTWLGGVAAAIVQALSGDFTGAWDTFKAANRDATGQYDKTLDEIYNSAVAHQKRMETLWNKPNLPTPAPTSGSKSAPADSAQAKKDMEAWVEAQHVKQESLKNNEEEWMAIENNILKRLKAAYGENSKEFQAELGRKIKMEQDYATQRKEVASIDDEMARDSAQHAVEMEKEKLANQVALGQISKKQEFETLRKFEDDQYALELKALEDKAKIYADDKVKYEKVLQEKQKLAEKYELAVTKLADQETQQYYNDWKNTMKSTSSIFEQGIDTMLTSQKSFNQQIKSLLSQLAMFFINDYIKKTVDNWLLKEQKEYAISLLFSKLKEALGIEQAATDAATRMGEADLIKASNMIIAEADAGVAATGAAASVASIPIVGPELAMADAAMVFAALQPYVAMATRGFDVPSGSNPLTQLHSEEMVLPAHLANIIRDLATGGKGGSSTTYQISALDTRSFMSRNGSQILKGIKGHIRNMNRKF